MIISHRLKDFERKWNYQTVDGIPYDVSGASCLFMVLDGNDPNDIIVSYSEDDYITLDNAGNVHLLVPGAVFDLASKDYSCFCRLTLATGELVLLEHTHLHVRHLPDEPVAPQGE